MNDPADIQSLAQVKDRISFLYVDHCTISRTDSAITISSPQGFIPIPAAQLGSLLLGPGTDISNAAIALLADSGAVTLWVGERGVRYYGHASALSQSTRLLEAQAKLVSSERARLKVARSMYSMRFPAEDVSKLTMQQLLGREGTRIRRIYQRESERTGVKWGGRNYNPEDFDASDEINKALTSANTALYGVVHSIICALGCSPGLGFIHTHNARSFVYDIADLYKAEMTIPLAFDLVKAESDDIAAEARKAIRDMMRDGRFMARCVCDIKRLLLPTGDDTPETGRDTNDLWAGASGTVQGGYNRGRTLQEEFDSIIGGLDISPEFTPTSEDVI